MNVFKKFAINFLFPILALASAASICLNLLLLVKTGEDQKTIAVASAAITKLQNELIIKNDKIAVMAFELDTKNKELGFVKAKLENAILPQATFAEAFNDVVAEPVSSTTKNLWSSLNTGAAKAWSYVFE